MFGKILKRVVDKNQLFPCLNVVTLWRFLQLEKSLRFTGRFREIRSRINWVNWVLVSAVALQLATRCTMSSKEG